MKFARQEGDSRLLSLPREVLGGPNLSLASKSAELSELSTVTRTYTAHTRKHTSDYTKGGEIEGEKESKEAKRRERKGKEQRESRSVRSQRRETKSKMDQLKIKQNRCTRREERERSSGNRTRFPHCWLSSNGAQITW